MEDKILEQTYKLMEWIELNFGRTGCFIFAFTVIALFALGLFLLSRLPESKTITIYSECSSCKYRRKKSNVFVLACRKHEKPRWYQFKTPPCPRQNDFEDWEVIKNQSDPAFFHEDNLPENIKELL